MCQFLVIHLIMQTFYRSRSIRGHKMEYYCGKFTLTDTFRIQVPNPDNSRKCTIIFINTNIEVLNRCEGNV